MTYKKRQKLWLIGAACVAALGAILFYLSHVLWVNPVASEVIKKLIKSSSKKYIIDYEDLQLNTLENEVNVNKIRIIYDSTQLAADDSTRVFFDLKMDRLNLAVNNIADVAYSNTLTVKHAILEAPKIQLYRDPDKKKEKNFEGWLRAYQFISEYLQSLEVNSFSIRNASFSTYELQGNDTVPKFQLDSINASFSYLSLDSAAIVNKNIVENIDDFSVEVKHYKRVFPDSLYRIEVESAKVDKKSATLWLEGVKLLPMYERYEFAQQVGYRKGRVTLKIPIVNFHGIDFSRLVEERAFVSENLSLDSLWLEVFSDKHMEEYKRYRKMIPEMLAALPFDFRIDTIRVTQGELIYEERPEGSEDTGGVNFTDLYATLYNTTNMVSEEQESVMVADIQTTFMDEANFDVTFRFPLFRDDLYHTIEGTLSAMPLAKLNDILEPAVNTSVKSGQLNKLEFTMELNQQKATGMMHFAYEDLKIELLGKDADDPKLKEKLGSFLANLVVIKSENSSRGDEKHREGPITFERIQEKAVFGYWMRALLSGVRVSVGIDKVPKRLTRRNNEVKKNRLAE